ncbi:MAG TPA: hypothetical protein VEC57_01890 [Candidatus Limnocylindrales bacterium]|nr:hypothetical protein [Candidatus Limnocylindrales bacterium]
MKAISTSILASLLFALSSMTATAADEAKPEAKPAAPSAPAASPSARTPEQTVEGYLKAMQEQKFGDAYELVSKALKAGKSKEEWSKEQQYIVQMGEVKIFGYKVFPAAVAADGTAKVPNILKSQDKFLNQLGLDEYELYELVKEDGVWKIDNQTLVEGAERSEYFPADAVAD